MVLAPLTTASRYSGEADASAAPQASSVAREPGWDRAYAHGELSLTNLGVLLGADSVLCSVGAGPWDAVAMGGFRVPDAPRSWGALTGRPFVAGYVDLFGRSSLRDST